jgi:dTDP-4-dehydrorhamnose 3,5-epimerase
VKMANGLSLMTPSVYRDNRGFFCESFNLENFTDNVGHALTFVQDNHSLSFKGTIRGLHYQIEPYAIGKLVRCIVGEIYDVAVDLRKGSKTFGKWYGFTLTAENKKQLWVPKGFAHGFQALTDAEVIYKTTGYWNKEAERTVAWDDKNIGIDWPLSEVILSEKDKLGTPLASAELFI